MPEAVKVDECRTLRDKIYGMIFPRWALISVIAVIFMVLAWLHNANATVRVEASNALKKAELVEAVLTTKTENIEDKLIEIKKMQGEQRELLQRIDRRLNGG